MKVILTKDVEKLGNAGDLVRVKDGYARNYLIPEGFAFVANEKNIKQLEFNRRIIEKKINSEIIAAKLIASKLAVCEIKIKKKVGDEGKLFGSVTNRDIEGALKENGFEIKHYDIVMDSNIKKSGVYDIEVKLFRDVRGSFKLWVVSEDIEDAKVKTEEVTEDVETADNVEKTENQE